MTPDPRPRFAPRCDMQRMNGSEPSMRGTARAAVRMGRPARRALMAGRGSVLAAFTSTLYLESKAGIACIVPPSMPCGPLNVVMPGFVPPAATDLDRAAWRADEAMLSIDGLGAFPLSPRAGWTPPRPPTVDATMLGAGLASMHAALAARPSRGEALPHAREAPLAGGIRVLPFDCGEPAHCDAIETPAESGPADARFAWSVPALERWIGDALHGRGASAPPPVTGLLGAGRGLTPSGDDCIAGALVALHAFGEHAVAASLSRAVARHAPRRTSRLSAAHLEAACTGEAIEPIHEAILAIAGDAPPAYALDALERFGHGSGFDALAGVLLAARAIAGTPMR